MKDSRRLFFALWPPGDLAARLYRDSGEIQARWGGRLMRPDTLHLTLAFLGDVANPDLPALLRLAEQIEAEAFELHLAGLAYWAHNGIVHAGLVPSPGLERLAFALRRACQKSGFLESASGFTPHLTLIRKATPGGDLPDLPPLGWRVDAFVLVESRPDQDGAHYEVLGRWKLASPAVSADTMPAY